MLKLRGVAVVLGMATVASCAPRPAAPQPEPEQPRQQAPRPQPLPAPPATTDWEEAPLTPGDWSYDGEGGGSAASFGSPGTPVFVVRCEPSRQLSLARTGAGGGAALVVRTTSGERSLPATPAGGALVASLSASDPFLDAIAFSRGRFAVEATGAPTLVVPAWPEIARVVEDCRA